MWFWQIVNETKNLVSLEIDYTLVNPVILNWVRGIEPEMFLIISQAAGVKYFPSLLRTTPMDFEIYNDIMNSEKAFSKTKKFKEFVSSKIDSYYNAVVEKKIKQWALSQFI